MNPRGHRRAAARGCGAGFFRRHRRPLHPIGRVPLARLAASL